MRILPLLALLLGAPALAQEPTLRLTQEQPHIVVSGQAEVTGRPDVMTAQLGVTVVGKEAAGTLATASQRTNAIIEALVKAGVAREDIQTSQYSANPEYDPEARKPKVVGYRVTSTVTAKIRDLDRAGQVLDAATAEGGDDLVVQGLSFDLEDDRELVRQARERAWADAQGKADQLAGLAGIGVGQPLMIRETFAPAPGPVPMMREAMVADQAMTIEPGQVGVTVILEVEFAIVPTRG